MQADHLQSPIMILVVKLEQVRRGLGVEGAKSGAAFLLGEVQFVDLLPVAEELPPDAATKLVDGLETALLLRGEPGEHPPECLLPPERAAACSRHGLTPDGTGRQDRRKDNQGSCRHE